MPLLTNLQDPTKAMVNKRDLGIYKSIDVTFAVHDEVLQVFETELSQFGPNLNPVD